MATQVAILVSLFTAFVITVSKARRLEPEDDELSSEDEELSSEDEELLPVSSALVEVHASNVSSAQTCVFHSSKVWCL